MGHARALAQVAPVVAGAGAVPAVVDLCLAVHALVLVSGFSRVGRRESSRVGRSLGTLAIALVVVRDVPVVSTNPYIALVILFTLNQNLIGCNRGEVVCFIVTLAGHVMNGSLCAVLVVAELHVRPPADFFTSLAIGFRTDDNRAGASSLAAAACHVARRPNGPGAILAIDVARLVHRVASNFSVRCAVVEAAEGAVAGERVYVAPDTGAASGRAFGEPVLALRGERAVDWAAMGVAVARLYGWATRLAAANWVNFDGSRTGLLAKSVAGLMAALRARAPLVRSETCTAFAAVGLCIRPVSVSGLRRPGVHLAVDVADLVGTAFRVATRVAMVAARFFDVAVRHLVQNAVAANAGVTIRKARQFRAVGGNTLGVDENFAVTVPLARTTGERRAVGKARAMRGMTVCVRDPIGVRTIAGAHTEGATCEPCQVGGRDAAVFGAS